MDKISDLFSGTSNVDTVDINSTLGVRDTKTSIKNTTDTTKVAVFDASGISTGTTRTMTVPDKNGKLAVSDVDFELTGDISPAQITSDQADYNPTNLATSAVLRLNTNASRNIGGLAGGSDGRVIIIYNVGSFNLVLKDEDAGSTAANRFALLGDITMKPDQCVILQYDSTTSRWRAMGVHAIADSDIASTAAIAKSKISTSGTWATADIPDISATYQAVSGKNAASGYAGLDGSSKLTGSQQKYGSIANTACEGNDGRLSDSRTPTAHKTSHEDGGSDAIGTLGSIAFAKDMAITGDISPTQITADQNNYNPTSLSISGVLRLNTDASRNITGLAGGADGRIIIIHNIGSFNFVLKDEDSNSTAGNRFALLADLTVRPDQCIILQYDITSSRWRTAGIQQIADADVVSGAAIAKSKISTSGAWAKTDQHANTAYTDSIQTFSTANTFNDQTLKLRNPANTFSYTLVHGAIGADRNLNLPVITGTDTLATLGLAQTFTAIETFNDSVIVSGCLSAANNTPATDQTIPANYSSIVVGSFEITSGTVLNISSGGVLAII